MNLFDNIFGKKKTIIHPILGVIESERIKGNNSSKSYTWNANVTINNYPEKTFIILEGNNEKPSANQMDYVSLVIEKWNFVYIPKIEVFIRQKGLHEFSNFKENFFLAAIYVTDQKNLFFELSFESLDTENDTGFSIVLKNVLNNSIAKY